MRVYRQWSGNLLVTAEGEFRNTWKPVLDPLGISFLEGTVAQTNDGMAANGKCAVITYDRSRHFGN